MLIDQNKKIFMPKYNEIKKMVLEASFEAGACHIGSALSCVKILVDLFYGKMKERDIFLFSKASGVATFYSILVDKGYFPKDKLAYYLKNYPLPSKEIPGVIHSVGSLGHGLPVAVGLALGDRTRNVYCLMSDGECQEGTTYESALFARQHKLSNLFVIVDDNQIQGLDYTSSILDLTTAYSFLKETLLNIDIVKTIKGEGVDFMEGKPEWHYRNLTAELLEKALCQI